MSVPALAQPDLQVKLSICLNQFTGAEWVGLRAKLIPVSYRIQPTRTARDVSISDITEIVFGLFPWAAEAR